MIRKQAILASAIAVGLTACGGGSSSGGESFSSNINTDPVVITHDNARQVASTSTAGVQSAGELGREDITDSQNLLGTSSGAFMDSASRMILGKSSTLTTRASSSVTQDCDGGGSIRVTVSDRNNNEEIDAGDSIAATFSNCVIVDEEDGSAGSVSGSGSLSIHAMSGNGTGDSEMDVTLTINDLTVSDSASGETVYVDGDVRLNAAVQNNVAVVSLSGSKIEMNDEDVFGLIRDYDMQQSYNQSTEAWTQSVGATLASSDIDGQIEITTPVPLQGTADNYPDVGTTTIEGAGGTYVSLNADTGDIDTVILTAYDGSTTISDEIFWTELED